jgi:hypothetical protein
MSRTTAEHRRALAPGAVTLVLAGLAALPAAAGVDCWVTPRLQVQAGPGHAGLVAPQAQALERLRIDRALNALPGVRLQADGHIGAAARGDALPVSELRVSLHRPPVWGPDCTLKQAAADYVSPANVEVSFNRLDPLWHLLATPADEAIAPWFPAPERAIGGHGETVWGRRVVLLTPPGRPAVLPLTVAEWLTLHERTLAEASRHGAAPAREALQALRAYRQRLAPSELAAAVALGPRSDGSPDWAYVTADTPGSVTLLRPNPALWAAARPGEVRLVALRVWLNDENEPLAGVLEGWLHGVDLAPYRALLSGSPPR